VGRRGFIILRINGTSEASSKGEGLMAKTKGGDYRRKVNQTTDNMLRNLMQRRDE
jgi:hypothetical protein